MSWFTNRNLVTQLLALFLTLSALVLVIGVVGMNQTRMLGGIVEDMHENQTLPIQELDQANDVVVRHYHRLLYAAQDGDVRGRLTLDQDLQRDREAFWKVYAVEMQTRPALGEPVVWARMPVDWAAYEEAAHQVAALVHAGHLPEARALSDSLLRARYETLRTALAAEIQMNADESASGFQASVTAMARARRQFLGAILAGFLLAIGMGVVFTRLLVRQVGGELTEASAIVTRLARGDLAGYIPLRPGDTSSLLARLKVLVLSLTRVTARAEAIGQGDLSREVELLSDKDQLGLAVNRMNALLRSARDEDARRNWLKDGTRGLAEALTGDFTPSQLAESAITALGRYTGAGRGVIYRHRPEDGDLELMAGYMYAPQPGQATRFRRGEGTIGQVALERAPMRLGAASGELVSIQTGTTLTPASCTYTFPVCHEGELLAVAELAGPEPFDALREEYLAAAGALIGPSLFVALQRERVAELLAVTERAERQARTQSEELQDANCRLEEQQQQLRQQTEELQASNAMMEEQQQQLQQQTEELQQSNAMMEEQHQQLQQTNEELRQYQVALDSKANQLEQSSRYKSEFLANMSHELRTPLNAIILLSRMMSEQEEGKPAPETRRWAEVVNHAGHDLLNLINDILDLSKVEAGRMEVHPSEVSSSVLASECQDLFGALAREKGLELVIEDRLKGSFSTDHDRLSQILRNLLANAFKFTKAGRVSLVMERRPGASLPVVLAVRDTGIGIPEEKLGLIFEAFQQADGSTSREFGGTGLGLTISLKFAQLLGGTIELASQAGKGSEFAVHLPDAAGAAEAPEPAAEPVRDDRDHLAPGAPTILLIDDDALFAMALVQINRRLGYQTLVAGTGAEGLALARSHKPSGILLDLGLPDLDGAEVLHRLKSDRELAALPVFVVSARDRDWALARRNIVGYLQKPVDDQQIAKAEAALLAVVTRVSDGDVLVVGSGGITAEDLARLLAQHGSPRAHEVTQVAPGDAFRAALAEHAWRLVIIDLAGVTLDEGLATAEAVRGAGHEGAMLFFCLKPPGEEDEARLRRYSDSIVIQSPYADRRLLDAMERFLQESAPPPPAPVPDRVLEGRAVLVVDDDPRNLFVLTAALERSGAVVQNAVNGRHALEVLGKGSADLIFLDIMMPEMDGFQTLAALRKDPRLGRIPVIALTAKAMAQDREDILAAGADDYLAKPVDHAALLEKAVRWCRDGRGPA